MKIINYDPKKPAAAFAFHIATLKAWGLWAPSGTWQDRLYFIYSLINLFLFPCFFVYTQYLHFFEIRGVKDLADSLYFFMIEIALIPKILFWLKNQERIKKCINDLESPESLPQTPEEEEVVGFSLLRCLAMHRSQLFLCFMCIVMWSLSTFFPSTGKFYLVSAVFPWKAEKGLGYAVAFVYQVIATAHCSFAHMSMDTMAVGLLFQVSAQFRILGARMEKIGHEEEEGALDRAKYYQELVTSVKRHKQIIQLKEEIEDIFKESMFLQFFSSLFGICTTEYLMLNFGTFLVFLSMLPYMMVTSCHMFIYCYTGSDVASASETLFHKLYYSNFLAFDMKTRKIFTIFMERLKREATVNTSILFELPLNFETFTSIMRATYSYCTFMQTVETN